PDSVRAWLAPLGATGSAIGLPRSSPERRCCSTKTGAATPLLSAVVPSPTRTADTTTVQVPWPSHAEASPSVHAVPAGASLTPQTPAEHVRAAHSVSVPGQSVGSWHCGASVVVVLEVVVGSVVVVAGAVVVVEAAVVVVVDVVDVVVVVVGCAAARL